MIRKLIILVAINFQLLQAQIPSICFEGASIYTFQSASDNGIDLVSEDFNSDGFPDIACGEVSSGKVILMIGNGDGTFIRSSSVFSTGSFPHELVSGDFNSDGKMDLVTVNSLSNSVSLLLGTGSGSFLPQQVFNVGNFPKSLVKSDFNNDGVLDIVASNYLSGTISVLIGSGNGAFLPAFSYPAVAGAEAITTGDYNNDGKQDLSLCSWTSSIVTVYYGNGNGTFQSAVNCSLNAFDNYPYSITTADLNNDNYDDLVVHDDLSYKFTVFLGTPSYTMSPSFIVGSSTPSGINMRRLGAKDINGDGNVDIITPETNILLGTGTGSFLATLSYTNFGGVSVITNDFDSDGRTDLGFMGGDLQIVLNKPLLSITSTPSIICAGQIASLTVTGANYYQWSTGQTATNIVVNPLNTFTYSVFGSNLNGCSDTRTITQVVSACTEISKSFSDENISNKIYPNPNDGCFTINLSDYRFDVEIKVYNVSGEIIFSKKVRDFEKTEFDLRSISSGIYYIQCSNTFNVLKFVKY
jgi:hypothetical protein